MNRTINWSYNATFCSLSAPNGAMLHSWWCSDSNWAIVSVDSCTGFSKGAGRGGGDGLGTKRQSPLK